MDTHAIKKSSHSTYTGIFLVIFAFLCAAIMNALGKVALQTTPLTILLFTQNLIACCLHVPFIVRQPKILKTSHWKLHILRATTGLLSYLCLFIAIKHISLVNATLLANSAPLFFPFIAFIWLREKITFKVFLSLLIGFIGVFVIVHPGTNAHTLFHSSMTLIALLGSFFSALALQCVRELRKSDASLTITFYYFFIASLIILPFAFHDWHLSSIENLKILIAIGVLLAITQLSLAQAYRYASPTILGPFNYSIVIFSGLIQWIYWKNIPPLLNILGVILISCGGILSILQANKKKGK